MQTVELVGTPQLVGLGFAISPKGSAIYENATEKDRFKDLQRVINTYLAKFLPNAKRISVDGKLGKKTLTARNAIMEHVGGRGLMGLKARGSVTDLANNASFDMLAIRGFTIGEGVPKLPSVLPDELAPPQTVAPQERITAKDQRDTEIIASGGRPSAVSPYAIMGVVGAVALVGIGVMYVRRR